MAEVVSSEAFEPNWAVPPGATIAAILAARSLSRESFAESLGESVDTNADRLSRCLGMSTPERKCIGAPLGQDQGEIDFHGGKIEVERPRVRARLGGEVALPSWEAALAEDWLGQWADADQRFDPRVWPRGAGCRIGCNMICNYVFTLGFVLCGRLIGDRTTNPAARHNRYSPKE